MDKPFVKCGIIGVGIIIMSLVLLRTYPSRVNILPEGFFTPIVAFEFAQSREEIMDLFGREDTSGRQRLIEGMNQGNRLDYIYMVLYTLFLFVFAAVCAKDSGKKVYLLGMVLAVLILVGDFFENRQLLAITAQLESGDFSRELELLHLYTWWKWGGLALYFLLLIPYFLKGSLYSILIGLTSIAVVVLTVIAFVNRSLANEMLTLAIAVQFVLMTFYSFTYRRRKRIIL